MRRSTSIPSTLDEIDGQDFSEELPHSHMSVVRYLISQIRPGMSLARVTLPTFILETRSTLERLTDWMVHADILRLVNDEDDKIMRMLHFCTWMVAGFHMGPRTPKKPYNSLLGECFRAALVAHDGSITGTYVAEQVSHHPPICAFHYADRAGGIAVWGHSELRSKFLIHSIAAIMDNENTKCNFEHLNRGETYQFNLPNMYGRGIVTGKLRMEICGKVRVRCPQTKVFAKIEFLEKPTLRGRYNCFKGIVYTEEKVKKKVKRVVQVSFSGRWSAYMKCKDERTGREWIAFDVRSAEPATIAVPDLRDQSAMESRFIWQKVSEYIRLGNMPKATDQKLALEERQRRLIKHMKETKAVWQPQEFSWDDAQQRFVPIRLDLSPWAAGEPPQAMPPPFEVPMVMGDLETAGAIMTFDQIHSVVDGLPPGAIQAPIIIPMDDDAAPAPGGASAIRSPKHSSDGGEADLDDSDQTS
jgi:hypothetical protein